MPTVEQSVEIALPPKDVNELSGNIAETAGVVTDVASDPTVRNFVRVVLRTA